jgi:flagellar basal-body rod protein FlgC
MKERRMDELTRTMSASASGMAAQAARLRLSSENIANVDTPGYHRKTISFETTFSALGGDDRAVRTGPVRLDQGELARIYDPTHPLAGEDGSYRGSNVNLVVEIADAREANRSYEANLRLFDQARQMASSLLDLLRR